MLLAAQQDFSKDIFLWLGVIVGSAVVLGIIAMILRKLLLGDPGPPPVGFTLADLRRLHEQGELDDEEFAQAKGRMLAQGRAMLHEPDTDTDGGMASGNPVDDWAPEAGDGPADGEPTR